MTLSRQISLLLLVIFMAIGPFVTAHANIGDTLAQLRGHYGSAKDMGAQMLFQHNGYSICVYFDGPKSAMEVFVRDGSKPEKTDITPQDIEDILAVEGGGVPWNAVQTNNGKQMWLSSDGHLVARLSAGEKSDDKFLTVMVNSTK